MRFFYFLLPLIFLFSTCHKKDPDANWLVGKWRAKYSNTRTVEAKFDGVRYILGKDDFDILRTSGDDYLFEIKNVNNTNLFSVPYDYANDTTTNFFDIEFMNDSFVLAKDFFILRKGLTWNNDQAFPLIKVKRMSKTKLKGRIIELVFSQRPYGLTQYNMAVVGDVEFTKEE